MQWYSVQPVGKTTMAKVVKNLKSANLNRYFMNHGLRCTSAMRLFQMGVESKIVCEIIGHVSDALNKYQEMSNAQKQKVSKVLNFTNASPKVVKKKKVEEPPWSPTPSLEISMSDRCEHGAGYQSSFSTI